MVIVRHGDGVLGARIRSILNPGSLMVLRTFYIEYVVVQQVLKLHLKNEDVSACIIFQYIMQLLLLRRNEKDLGNIPYLAEVT